MTPSDSQPGQPPGQTYPMRPRVQGLERDEDAVGTYPPAQQAEVDVSARTAAVVTQVSDLRDQVGAALGQQVLPIAQGCAQLQGAICAQIESILTDLCAAQQQIGSAIGSHLASRTDSICATASQLQATERKTIYRLERRGYTGIVCTADVTAPPIGDCPPQSGPPRAPVVASPAGPQGPAPLCPPNDQLFPPAPTQQQLAGFYAPLAAEGGPFALATMPVDGWSVNNGWGYFWSLQASPLTLGWVPILRESNGEFAAAGQLFINITQDMPNFAPGTLLAQFGVPDGVGVALTRQQAYDASVQLWGEPCTRLVWCQYGLTPPVPPVDRMPTLRTRAPDGILPQVLPDQVPKPPPNVVPESNPLLALLFPAAALTGALPGVGTGPIVPPIPGIIPALTPLVAGTPLAPLLPALQAWWANFRMPSECDVVKFVAPFVGMDGNLIFPCKSMADMDRFLEGG